MGNARLEFVDLDPCLTVRRFQVREQLNQPFAVELQAMAPDESLDLGELVGRRATFELSGTVERRWRGQVARAQVTGTAEDGTGLASFSLTLVPTLWRLTQRRGQRAFQHLSIPTIVEQILTEWRIPQRWAIEPAHYPKLELRTQYAEDDLRFLRRLLEEAGIAFYIDDQGEEDATLVFDDALPSREPRADPLPFVDATFQSLAAETEFATALCIEEQSLPGAYTVVDHDPRRPRLPLFAGDQSERESDLLHEQYVYAPGQFLAEHEAPTSARDAGETPVADNHGTARSQEQQGQTLAQVMREAADVQRKRFRFETGVNDLRPGTVLRVVNHPRADVTERPLLVDTFALSGEVAQTENWRFEASGVFADLPYRPPLETPKPRSYGLQTAVVVGQGQGESRMATEPNGDDDTAVALDRGQVESRLVDEDIYVDELGRVRVQFTWDREGQFDSSSSIWMRVAQAWAGAGYGIRATPRVGHEVLVAFVDGDPDAPLIVGSVHNAVEQGAFKLPENKTVSSWRSCSSPGGEGFNELRFDDAKDREHVYFQAERDMDELIKRDRSCAIGHDASRSVQNRDALMVGHDRVKNVNHNEVETTGLNRCSVVGVNRVATVGVEDSTHVGTRWSVSIARGLSSKLAQGIEGLFGGPLAAVARSAATTMVGRIPFDPLATAVDTAFTRFGENATSAMRNVLGTLEGFVGEEGPPPTSIEMVDRQIKLSTGDASITLDGPNIILTAQGSITMHAMESASLLAEDEVAVAARNRAALVSATDEVVVQAAKTLQLNPFDPGSAPAPAQGMEEPAPPEVDAPAPGGSGGPGGILEDLPPETAKLADQSPTLKRQLAELDAKGWTVVQGPAGGGSYCQAKKKLIVVAKNPADKQVGTLGHEVGHALYKQPKIGMKGLTREQYISANVNEHLRNEGNAQLNAGQVRAELAKAGKRIPWPGGPAYGRVYDKYARGKLTRDEAVDEMGALVAKGRTSTTRENYVTYYSRPYQDHWDKYH